MEGGHCPPFPYCWRCPPQKSGQFILSVILSELPALNHEESEGAINHAPTDWATRRASAKSRLPSYRARPTMTPTTPRGSRGRKSVVSSRELTPPEAST